jgi:hypothetical protein
LPDHDTIMPLFARRPAVTLRARWPHRTTQEFMRPRVEQLLGGALDEAVITIARRARGRRI